MKNATLSAPQKKRKEKKRKEKETTYSAISATFSFLLYPLLTDNPIKAMNEGRSFRYEFIYPSSNQEDEYDSEAVVDDSGHTSRDERHRNDSGASDASDMMASRLERTVTQ